MHLQLIGGFHFGYPPGFYGPSRFCPASSSHRNPCIFFPLLISSGFVRAACPPVKISFFFPLVLTKFRLPSAFPLLPQFKPPFSASKTSCWWSSLRFFYCCPLLDRGVSRTTSHPPAPRFTVSSLLLTLFNRVRQLTISTLTPSTSVSTVPDPFFL